MLEQWLEYHRDTLLTKCAGLDADRLAERSAPPSTLSLLGLVRHLAEVENGWFGSFEGRPWEPLYCSDDEPDGDFDLVDPARADVDLATFLAAVAASRLMAARHRLDDVSRAPDHQEPIALRWIFVHMIEEYARHNGHADILRQVIDGTTGE